MYSRRWWFWTKKGRRLWRECKAKGEASPFWAENQCAKHIKPEKGSKWWWWTTTGRAVWKQCKEKGDASPFWKENNCDAGRFFLYIGLFLRHSFEFSFISRPHAPFM